MTTPGLNMVEISILDETVFSDHPSSYRVSCRRVDRGLFRSLVTNVCYSSLEGHASVYCRNHECVPLAHCYCDAGDYARVHSTELEALLRLEID